MEVSILNMNKKVIDMKKLYRILSIIIVLAAFVACTKNEDNKGGKPEIPFLGEWIASENPMHIQIETENGKIEVPVMGEISNAKAEALIKTLVSDNFNFEDASIIFSEIDENGYNVMMDAAFADEHQSINGKYDEGHLTIHIKIDDPAIGNIDTDIVLCVLQETPDDLRLYIEKEEIVKLIESGNIQFVNNTKAGFDISSILSQTTKIEFGINLQRYE